MRKLLVPVDNSENALRALRHAIKLAKENKAIELHIVYAHEPPVVYGEIAIYLTEEKAKKLQRQHSEDILGPAIKLAKSAGVKFTTKVLIGNISKKIVAYAEKIGCEGIVMGTRGMGAIGGLVMGSIATKVVHLTKLPVTLVK
jgi:nucleotide-binding universal stress UspA family protein